MTLEAAYRATTYQATLDGRTICLRIGEPADDLDGTPIDEWVFITAWNPRSQAYSTEENHHRQQALVAVLKARGKNYEPGLGIPDPPSNWKPEQSFLVWPVGRDEALELRDRFEQNAVVWGRRGEAPELLLVAGEGDSGL